MKTIPLLMKMAGIVALSAVLCSCGSDGDGSPENAGGTGGGGAPSIVGVWRASGATIGGVTFTAEQLEGMGFSQVVTFNADGTYVTVSTDAGGSETDTGTWSVNGNILTITVTGDPDVAYLPFTLSGNTLSWTVDYGQGTLGVAYYVRQ